jgi:hypothetical protein
MIIFVGVEIKVSTMYLGKDLPKQIEKRIV